MRRWKARSACSEFLHCVAQISFFRRLRNHTHTHLRTQRYPSDRLPRTVSMSLSLSALENLAHCRDGGGDSIIIFVLNKCILVVYTTGFHAARETAYLVGYRTERSALRNAMNEYEYIPNSTNWPQFRIVSTLRLPDLLRDLLPRYPLSSTSSARIPVSPSDPRRSD